VRVPGIPPALDAIVMRGLAQRPQDRFATALDMARALDSVIAFNPVRPHELSTWLRDVGADALQRQARVPAELRRSTLPPIASAPPPRSLHPLHPLSLLTKLPPAQQNWAICAALFALGSVWGLLFMMTVSPTLGVE
jgi:hypothetical protein